jgi:hypothetical protein
MSVVEKNNLNLEKKACEEVELRKKMFLEKMSFY